MKRCELGRSGLEVSRLCFGGNVFGWTADEATSFSLLDALVDAGVDFIDTADVYSRWVPGHQGGESETVIGKWFAKTGKRAKVFLATKVGMDMGGDHKGLSARWIEQAVEDSLRRLQTDYIDLYQSHADDESVPVDETLRAYERLIAAGKVRVIGASNFGAARLREALDLADTQRLPRYQTLQPLYNLYDRAVFENELQALCVERGVGVITYFSLAAGFLTGKYRSEADYGKSARGPRAIPQYMNPRGMRILDALDAVSAELGSTPAKVAIAWLLTRPSVTAPIASATSLAQLRDLVDAVQLALPPEAVRRLDQASDPSVSASD
ncbi:MAG: aldo/keto reductase [Burkholderiaceae bacterium]